MSFCFDLIWYLEDSVPGWKVIGPLELKYINFLAVYSIEVTKLKMNVNSKVILLSRCVEYKEIIPGVIVIHQWESFGSQNIFFVHS